MREANLIIQCFNVKQPCLCLKISNMIFVGLFLNALTFAISKKKIQDFLIKKMRYLMFHQEGGSNAGNLARY